MTHKFLAKLFKIRKIGVRISQNVPENDVKTIPIEYQMTNFDIYLFVHET